MNHIHLTGQLLCRSGEEVAAVSALLPEHIRLTRAEAGCISFAVTPTDNPHIWDVREEFSDAGSFQLHQERARSSAWGLGTAGIKRVYAIRGL